MTIGWYNSVSVDWLTENRRGLVRSDVRYSTALLLLPRLLYDLLNEVVGRDGLRFDSESELSPNTCTLGVYQDDLPWIRGIS